MSFTYVAGTDDARTWVREMIGDVDSTDPLLQDQTIDLLLTKQSVRNYAAAACCVIIMGRLARKVAKTVGKTSLALQQQFDHYRDLKDVLLQGGPGDLPMADGSGTPTLDTFTGGISEGIEDTLSDDTDRIQPSFRVRQTDTPGSNAPFAAQDRRWWSG